ncbi:MAG: family 78 glycoside hydrolase catalytic domain, partial [Muribaculaceae bacterium]|nr:family 78 glycoside hydrolase catalytic domain [Muribaculaceae bacterium]
MNRKILYMVLLSILSGTNYMFSVEALAVGKRTNTLDLGLWKVSEWISVKDTPVITGRIEGSNERAADGSDWFLSTVKNDKKVVSAKWMTSGLGVYNLFVNGKPIGEEVLKPGFTHYAKTKLSFTYDITEAISTRKNAENTFAVQVTPGWWGDKIITPAGHDGMIGKKVAFRGVLELTYSDGSKKYYGTNTCDWKAGTGGPVKHAAIFDGEEYDAREKPAYFGAFFLAEPEVNDEFTGNIFPSVGAEVYRRYDLALTPQKAYKWKDVTGSNNDEYGKVVIVEEFDGSKDYVVRPGETLVIDFGQNCAAVPMFEFKAMKGTSLKCYPSEMLNDGNGAKNRGMDGPEGSVHRLNLRIPDSGMLLKYTFGDNNDYVSYLPECTFYGYRYISVDVDDEVHIKSVKSIPITSIANTLETGTITTGNPLINQLISNTM